MDEERLSSGGACLPGAKGTDIGRHVERSSGWDHDARLERIPHALLQTPAGDIDGHSERIGQFDKLFLLVAGDRVVIDFAEIDLRRADLSGGDRRAMLRPTIHKGDESGNVVEVEVVVQVKIDIAPQ